MRGKIANKRYINAIVSVCTVLIVLLFSYVNNDKILEGIEIIRGNRFNSNLTKESTFTLSDYPFSVSFIDVEQGDCELVICGDTVVLIDGGEVEKSGIVLDYLENNAISEIDYYILTHPHSDHIGASSTIVDSIACKSVVMTDFSENNIPASGIFSDLIDSIEDNNCEIITASAGDVINAGELELKFFAPVYETDDYNDMSLVFTVSYLDSKVLFTGDASYSVEKDIIESNDDISADVLKIAHHGSSTSTCEEFIDAVSPEYAVISCGADNRYGHPHREIISLLNEKEIIFKRTDYCGTIIYYGDGKNMTFAEYGNEIFD